MNRRELQRYIIEACQDWMALEDIASAVERDNDYLLNHVIPTMLEEGLIERMYPQTPRHPNQKYKAKQKE